MSEALLLSALAWAGERALSYLKKRAAARKADAQYEAFQAQLDALARQADAIVKKLEGIGTSP